MIYRLLRLALVSGALNVNTVISIISLRILKKEIVNRTSEWHELSKFRSKTYESLKNLIYWRKYLNPLRSGGALF